MVNGSNSLNQWRILIVESLLHIYELSEAEAVAKRFLSELFNLTATDWVIRRNEIFSQTTQLIEYWRRLRNAEPLQYILGYEYFCDQKIELSSFCLIPRPETEYLVYHFRKRIAGWQVDGLEIFDWGAGSGCISKALPEFKIQEIENSKSLKMSMPNRNMLDQIPDTKSPKIIISNPPYVDFEDIQKMDLNVLFEPPNAIVIADKHFLFQEISNSFQKNGVIAWLLEVSAHFFDDFSDKSLKIEILERLANIEIVLISQTTIQN